MYKNNGMDSAPLLPIALAWVLGIILSPVISLSPLAVLGRRSPCRVDGHREKAIAFVLPSPYRRLFVRWLKDFIATSPKVTGRCPLPDRS